MSIELMERVLPWNRHVAPLSEPMPPSEALAQLERIDVQVATPSMKSPFTGEIIQSYDHVMVLRSASSRDKDKNQNGIVVGTASKFYTPVTPEEGMSAWEEEFKDASGNPYPVHTIGYTNNYSAMFAVAPIGESGFRLKNGKMQPYGHYAFYWNPLHPGNAVKLKQMYVIRVCTNGMIAETTTFERTLSHYIEAPNRTRGLFVNSSEALVGSETRMQGVVALLSGKPMGVDDVRGVAEMVWSHPPKPRKNVQAITPYEQRVYQYEQGVERRKAKIEYLTNLFEAGPTGAKEYGFEGTAWAAHNAFTEMLTHMSSKGDRWQQMVDADRNRVANVSERLIIDFARNN